MADITKKKMEQIADVECARQGSDYPHSARDRKGLERRCSGRIPFNPDFCVDSDQTLLHGGILTALLDSVFGLENFVAIEGVSTMATPDLRVDYLRPAHSRAFLSTNPPYCL